MLRTHSPNSSRITPSNSTSNLAQLNIVAQSQHNQLSRQNSSQQLSRQSSRRGLSRPSSRHHSRANSRAVSFRSFSSNYSPDELVAALVQNYSMFGYTKSWRRILTIEFNRIFKSINLNERQERLSADSILKIIQTLCKSSFQILHHGVYSSAAHFQLEYNLRTIINLLNTISSLPASIRDNVSDAVATLSIRYKEYSTSKRSSLTSSDNSEPKPVDQQSEKDRVGSRSTKRRSSSTGSFSDYNLDFLQLYIRDLVYNRSRRKKATSRSSFQAALYDGVELAAALEEMLLDVTQRTQNAHEKFHNLVLYYNIMLEWGRPHPACIEVFTSHLCRVAADEVEQYGNHISLQAWESMLSDNADLDRKQNMERVPLASTTFLIFGVLDSAQMLLALISNSSEDFSKSYNNLEELGISILKGIDADFLRVKSIELLSTLSLSNMLLNSQVRSWIKAQTDSDSLYEKFAEQRRLAKKWKSYNMEINRVLVEFSTFDDLSDVELESQSELSDEEDVSLEIGVADLIEMSEPNEYARSFIDDIHVANTSQGSLILNESFQRNIPKPRKSLQEDLSATENLLAPALFISDGGKVASDVNDATSERITTPNSLRTLQPSPRASMNLIFTPSLESEGDDGDSSFTTNEVVADVFRSSNPVLEEKNSTKSNAVYSYLPSIQTTTNPELHFRNDKLAQPFTILIEEENSKVNYPSTPIGPPPTTMPPEVPEKSLYLPSYRKGLSSSEIPREQPKATELMQSRKSTVSVESSKTSFIEKITTLSEMSRSFTMSRVSDYVDALEAHTLNNSTTSLNALEINSPENSISDANHHSDNDQEVHLLPIFNGLDSDQRRRSYILAQASAAATITPMPMSPELSKMDFAQSSVRIPTLSWGNTESESVPTSAVNSTMDHFSSNKSSTPSGVEIRLPQTETFMDKFPKSDYTRGIERQIHTPERLKLKLDMRDVTNRASKDKIIRSLRQRARKLMNEEFYGEAKPLFDECLSIDPDDPVSLQGKGYVLLKTKDFAEAIINLNRSLEIRPDNHHALTCRAEAHKSMGHLSRALEDLDHSLHLEPNAVYALSMRAEVYCELGEVERGIKDCEDALLHEPRNVYTMTVRANLSFLKKDYKSSLEDFNNILAIEPHNASAYASRGRLRQFTGDYPRALRDLDCSIAISPEDASVLRDRARILIYLNQPEKALQAFFDSLELEPHSGPALRSVGKLLQGLGQPEEALKMLNCSMRIEPDFHTLLNRAEVFRDLQHYDSAIRDIALALKLRPDEPLALVVRANIYLYLNSCEKAMMDLDKSLAIKPDNPVALKIRGHAGVILGRYRQALDDFNLSLHYDPEDMSLILARGDVYHKLKQYELALADAIIYLKRMPASQEGVMLRSAIETDVKKLGGNKTWRKMIKRVENK